MKKKWKDMEQTLRAAESAEPPAGQKERILARAAALPQDTAAAPAASSRRRRTAYWKLASAFAVFAVILSASVAHFGGKAMTNEADISLTDRTSGELYATYADTTGGLPLATGAVDYTKAEACESYACDAPSEKDAMGMDGAAAEGGAPVGLPAQNQQLAAGLLTAGEWCDNDDFAFFQSVLNHNDWYPYQEVYSLSIHDRLAVTVSDGQGAPVQNAAVTLNDAQGSALYSAVTDHAGRAYLFALSEEAAQAAVSVAVSGPDGASVTESVPDGADSLAVTLGSAGSKPQILDLMFVIDSTGSMSDELYYLQNELNDVIQTVAADHPEMQIRLSVNFYRDEGDAYVVLPFDFTDDIAAGLKALAAQFADGGGDYPEAVDSALANALNGHDWSDGSVKLLYLVLDAPPHSEDEAVVSRIGELIPAFAAEGIRVIPVASSGVDTETEFFLRNLAALTGGTYTFLTNDSGIGGDHLEPTIGEYAVRPLNELLIEITNRYCG
ncbi:MAG: VWA domain-containing protein [Clostridiales bacterium]|nr:MAG: VWA domain-containing protein [Clostridiales bacterium]